MKPVLQVFGAMLIHEHFQREMQENPEGTLNARGYTLSAHEWEVMLRIVRSFKGGKLTDATVNVRRECPNWPCEDNSLEA